jgi:propionyl-CoA synthetase
MSYRRLFERSLREPQAFWGEIAEDLVWTKKWERVLDDSRPPFYRWFVGGEMNTCDNAVDRHVREGFGEQLALIYDSPVTDSQRKISYAEFRDEVARLAGALAKQGIGVGDRVIIYMPMVPEAIFAMLACARLGAVHSVVFGGFGAKELAARIDDAQASFVLSASCGLEPGRTIDYKRLLDEALKQATHTVKGCAILQRPQLPCDLVAGRDIDWGEFVAGAEPVDCVPVAATDPLYILYTSGTTGKPKGIVRDNGGHAAALRWTMKHLYDVRPSEVYWAASDIGWVVGHSYIVYAPLLNRNTTILYEGKPVGTPDAGAFWRVIGEHKAVAMFTAPTAIRAIKKEDPDGRLVKQYDLSSLRTQFLAGERCDPDTLEWAQKHLAVPVIDHWWQTETGWSIATNPIGVESFPIKPGSAGVMAPGYDLCALNDKGDAVAAGELGNLAVKLPLPPGSFPTIWGDEERMRTGYLSAYPGHYLTGDSGMIDAEGYVHVMSRIDDIINVAAHRLSTGQMEEVLCSHPDVAEAAVFGVADDFKGELPLGLVVVNSNAAIDEESLRKALIARIREQIGAVASFKLLAIVARLPKTRSGKILRGIMRKIANGEPYETPATIDDPAILSEVGAALEGLGYPVQR